MQSTEMLQYLYILKEASRKKADALEKLVQIAYDLIDGTEMDVDPSDYAAFDDAITAVDDKATEMSNFADDVESLLDDYAELLSENAHCVQTLIDDFIFPADFRKFCESRETYL